MPLPPTSDNNKQLLKPLKTSNFMRQATTNVYSFNELSDDAKEKAIDNLRYLLVEGDWWSMSIYPDAENIGLKITSFDLDRNRHAKGEFISSAEECAHNIEKEHGETCETYSTAKNYLSERDNLIDTWEKDEEGEFIDEWELDRQLDDLDEQFLNDILEDYSIMLQNECEYLQSDEVIIETIEVNEYEFTEEGERI